MSSTLNPFEDVNTFFDTLSLQTDQKDLLNKILRTPPEVIYANKNAVELLREYINEDEWHELMNTGFLRIKSTVTKDRHFIVSAQPSATITVVDGAEPSMTLCTNPQNSGNYALPAADSVLCKIVTIKANESLLFANSNVQRLRATETTVPTRTRSWSRLDLQKRHETFDVKQVALLSTPPMLPLIPQDLIEESIRYVGSCAILDGLAMNESGLCVRGLIPTLDLLAGQRNFTARSFRTPQNGFYGKEKHHTAFCSDVFSNNEHKCICVYGMMNLRPSLARYEAAMCYANRVKGFDFDYLAVDSVKTKRGPRVIDWVNVAILNKQEYMWFRTPSLWKRGDKMSLVYVLNDYAEGHYDILMPLGVVAEPINTNMCG